MPVVKLIDSNQRGLVTYEPVDILPNGDVPTDSIVDNVLYRKKGGIYYQRIITDSIIRVDWFANYDVNPTDIDTGAILNSIFTTLKNTVPEGARAKVIVEFGARTYYIKSIINFQNSFMILRGARKAKTLLSFSNASYINLDSITNLEIGDMTLAGDGTGNQVIKLNYCRESVFHDLQITGGYTQCSIYYGDNCWSNKLNDITIANLTTGDGIYFYGHDTNSVQMNRCFVTNIMVGCGIRIRGCNGLTISKIQMERNTNGCIVLEPGLYTKALTINDIYHENGGASESKPFLWIDNPTGTVMSARGIRINSGLLFMADNIAFDFSGFPSLSGSMITGLEIRGTQFYTVANGAIKFNSSGVVSGVIDVPMPYGQDLGEQPLLTPDTNIATQRVQIHTKTRLGGYGFTVPFSIGKKNPNIPTYPDNL